MYKKLINKFALLLTVLVNNSNAMESNTLQENKALKIRIRPKNITETTSTSSILAESMDYNQSPNLSSIPVQMPHISTSTIWPNNFPSVQWRILNQYQAQYLLLNLGREDVNTDNNIYEASIINNEVIITETPIVNNQPLNSHKIYIQFYDTSDNPNNEFLSNLCNSEINNTFFAIMVNNKISEQKYKVIFNNDRSASLQKIG